MMLAFKLADIVQIPFGYLLDWLYQLTTNYGVALILFALLVKLILLPATAKGKKNSMKMSRLSPQLQAIQKKYEKDPQKQQQATQALYKAAGVSMGGGCLWSMLPLLILIPLYTVIRSPITYMLHETADAVAKIVDVVKTGAPAYFSNNSYYQELAAAPLIPQFREALEGIVTHVRTLDGLNFNFLGIDLGAIPSFNPFSWEVYDWAHIGAFLIPILSAGSQILSMLISQKMNNSLVTDEKGVQDKETAKNSQTNQTGKVMLYMMPIMSLWIGFTVPAALSLYWLMQGVSSTVVDVLLTKRYRKDYDAEDMERLQRALMQEAEEEEKERLRAERRAENPDGITTNTSKKKLQQMQQKEADAAKAAAKKEYDAKRGIVSEEPDEPKPLSGIQDRPFCKGRNYDPNRYASQSTEE